MLSSSEEGTDTVGFALVEPLGICSKLSPPGLRQVIDTGRCGDAGLDRSAAQQDTCKAALSELPWMVSAIHTSRKINLGGSRWCWPALWCRVVLWSSCQCHIFACFDTTGSTEQLQSNTWELLFLISINKYTQSGRMVAFTAETKIYYSMVLVIKVNK